MKQNTKYSTLKLLENKKEDLIKAKNTKSMNSLLGFIGSLGIGFTLGASFYNDQLKQEIINSYYYSSSLNVLANVNTAPIILSSGGIALLSGVASFMLLSGPAIISYYYKKSKYNTMIKDYNELHNDSLSFEK